MPIKFRRILPQVIRTEEAFQCPVAGSREILSNEEITARIAAVQADPETPGVTTLEEPTTRQTGITPAP